MSLLLVVKSGEENSSISSVALGWARELAKSEMLHFLPAHTFFLWRSSNRVFSRVECGVSYDVRWWGKDRFRFSWCSEDRILLESLVDQLLVIFPHMLVFFSVN